jgi:hypothetical protein
MSNFNLVDYSDSDSDQTAKRQMIKTQNQSSPLKTSGEDVSKTTLVSSGKDARGLHQHLFDILPENILERAKTVESRNLTLTQRKMVFSTRFECISKIFSTRFECSFTSFSLVSSVFFSYPL